MASQRKNPTYNAWNNARHRCLNKLHRNYPGYGGRGITFYDGWKDNYTAFLEHVGERPGPEYSLERLGNDRGYEPGNVTWATRSEQQKNKRTTWSNQRNPIYENITIGGITKHADEWADFIGVKRCTFRARIRYGIQGEALITEGRAPRRTFKHKQEFRLERSDKPRIIYPQRAITWNGETHNATEWSRIVGLPRDLIAERRRKGWDAEAILTTPRGSKRPR
ncbi:hypothetical protein [Brevundimonas sp.]|uniref:hypothetical protein n=1 Tax=Brevundimonas sp. TaxID=1871086 RepID=UPI00289AF359|nr:hypothetical protein [Brevundimonas sp.]